MVAQIDLGEGEDDGQEHDEEVEPVPRRAPPQPEEGRHALHHSAMGLEHPGFRYWPRVGRLLHLG